MKAWVQLLGAIKEGYLVRRVRVVKVKYSKIVIQLCNLLAKYGLISSYEIKQYYNYKKKKNLIGVFVRLKYFNNRAVIKDIKIIPITRFGTRYGRVGLKYKQIEKLLNSDLYIFHSEKGLHFGDLNFMYKIGGFPVCKIII